ncbi:unnamed protein product [Spirodela intermedia]|uniref:Uncharacterized protein n=1 Tax=Spirodela intermedia TaxID=51605 RepID=A0A7I8JRL8_SPIIN|nr:unnamed protein product [Spirodela intermedia]CAA6672405.1 unnamed protein product [Spirodela intermedia]
MWSQYPTTSSWNPSWAGEGADAIFYSYTRHINGFAAHLEEEEAMEISKSPAVIAVFPNQMHALHTTRSWEFLGLESDGIVPDDSIWRKARGVPESASFNDDGLGPIPSRWKGSCESSPSDPIRCNRYEADRARFFNKGYLAAGGTLTASQITSRDTDGHGTHTLATAAGRFRPGGGVQGVLGPTEGGRCFDADILAAFDQAIEDGVDVLSVSLGHRASDYIKDGLAIGSFHAVKDGITVGQSLSASSLPADQSYPLISSVDARAANSTLDEA